MGRRRNELSGRPPATPLTKGLAASTAAETSSPALERCVICLSMRRCAHVRPHPLPGGRQICGSSAVCVPCSELLVDKFHSGADGWRGQFACPICRANLGPRRRALQEGSDVLRWAVPPETPQEKWKTAPDHPMFDAVRRRDIPELRRLAGVLAAREGGAATSAVDADAPAPSASASSSLARELAAPASLEAVPALRPASPKAGQAPLRAARSPDEAASSSEHVPRPESSGSVSSVPVKSGTAAQSRDPQNASETASRQREEVTDAAAESGTNLDELQRQGSVDALPAGDVAGDVATGAPNNEDNITERPAAVSTERPYAPDIIAAVPVTHAEAIGDRQVVEKCPLDSEAESHARDADSRCKSPHAAEHCKSDLEAEMEDIMAEDSAYISTLSSTSLRADTSCSDGGHEQQDMCSDVREDYADAASHDQHDDARESSSASLRPSAIETENDLTIRSAISECRDAQESQVDMNADVSTAEEKEGTLATADATNHERETSSEDAQVICSGEKVVCEGGSPVPVSQWMSAIMDEKDSPGTENDAASAVAAYENEQGAEFNGIAAHPQVDAADVEPSIQAIESDELKQSTATTCTTNQVVTCEAEVEQPIASLSVVPATPAAVPSASRNTERGLLSAAHIVSKAMDGPSLLGSFRPSQNLKTYPRKRGLSTRADLDFGSISTASSKESPWVQLQHRIKGQLQEQNELLQQQLRVQAQRRENLRLRADKADGRQTLAKDRRGVGSMEDQSQANMQKSEQRRRKRSRPASAKQLCEPRPLALLPPQSNEMSVSNAAINTSSCSTVNSDANVPFDQAAGAEPPLAKRAR
eukprot:TRINITY_DN64158_c0_g1_i1.p1 TRINITY_DN64158_c0_g1~~TRINITY_DN64158_c0_g1_i1.p1  ORF type:complete len:822 (-),score=124.99 TRINITY_DN64158_c0_g1_i1:269-2734(-)